MNPLGPLKPPHSFIMLSCLESFVSCKAKPLVSMYTPLSRGTSKSALLGPSPCYPSRALDTLIAKPCTGWPLCHPSLGHSPRDNSPGCLSLLAQQRFPQAHHRCSLYPWSSKCIEAGSVISILSRLTSGHCQKSRECPLVGIGLIRTGLGCVADLLQPVFRSVVQNYLNFTPGSACRGALCVCVPVLVAGCPSDRAVGP